MGIEWLAELQTATGNEAALTLLFLAAGAAAALSLHRWGQLRSLRKHGDRTARFFPHGASAWGKTVFFLLFFLLTGALRTEPLPDDTDRTKRDAARLLFAGFRFSFYGAAVSFLLYTAAQFAVSASGNTDLLWLMMIPEALLRANLSAMWVNLLPLPGLDGGVLLTAYLPQKRRDGFCAAKTVSFFLFVALAVFFARAGLLGTATLFPIRLITP